MDTETLRLLQQSIVLSSGMPFHPAQVQPQQSIPIISACGHDYTSSSHEDWPRSLTEHWWFGQSQHQGLTPATSSLLEPKPTPPLLRLPPELLILIFRYLLPQTTSLKKPSARRPYGSDVVWRRASTSLLATCRTLHDAAADFLYGNNVFVLRTRFDGTEFNLKRLKLGLVPTTTPPFPACFATQYIAKIRKIVLFIEVVDEYTGTIKYGYGSRGQLAGVRSQVASLSKVLNQCEELHDVNIVLEACGDVGNVNQVLEPLKPLCATGAKIRVTSKNPARYQEDLSLQGE